MKKSILILIILFFSACNAYSQLIWSTYLGGSSGATYGGMEVDDSENVYISGTTGFKDFPITPGAYDSINNTIGIMNFITKFDSTGSNLIFSTFIGRVNFNFDLSIDKFGNSYITGRTNLPYPITTGVFDSIRLTNSINDSSSFYVTKVNSTGTALVYSTFLDGTESDQTHMHSGIKVDSIGNAYISGSTEAKDFPITTGAYDTIFNMDGKYTALYNDVFVTKMNPYGSSLIYSSFIGGSDSDWGMSFTIDSIFEVYLTGGTSSYDFPTTNLAFKKSFEHPTVFITKLNPKGNGLIFSTFFGGKFNKGGESANSITLDQDNNVYISGSTISTDFPTTRNAYDTSFNGLAISDNPDIFISKFNPNCDSIIFSTFLGGIKRDYLKSISLDKDRNVYIFGTTYSTDFPITMDAFQKSFNANSSNYLSDFISKLSLDGNNLIYSTFLGCDFASYGGNDGKIFVDTSNNVFLTTDVWTDNYPITKDAYQKQFHGFRDIYISRLQLCNCLPKFEDVKFPNIVCGSYLEDTIIIYNSCKIALDLDSIEFGGPNTNEFSVTEPKSFPSITNSGNSLRLIIRFTPTKNIGSKVANITLINNMTFDPCKIKPYDIYMTGSNDSIAFNIGDTDSDTIIIDFGKFCPGSGTIDTTITIFNKSSIGTTFKIEKPDNPAFQITPGGKAGKKEGNKPQGVKKK